MTTDVQLTVTEVALDFGGVELDSVRPAVGEAMVILSPDEFDVFAEQVAEAALNKRGMEAVMRPVEEAEIGWFYHELEIVLVRPFYKGLDGMTAINFKAAPAFLLIESGLMLTFHRPIQ